MKIIWGDWKEFFETAPSTAPFPNGWIHSILLLVILFTMAVKIETMKNNITELQARVVTLESGKTESQKEQK